MRSDGELAVTFTVNIIYSVSKFNGTLYFLGKHTFQHSWYISQNTCSHCCYYQYFLIVTAKKSEPCIFTYMRKSCHVSGFRPVARWLML